MCFFFLNNLENPWDFGFVSNVTERWNRKLLLCFLQSLVISLVQCPTAPWTPPHEDSSCSLFFVLTAWFLRVLAELQLDEFKSKQVYNLLNIINFDYPRKEGRSPSLDIPTSKHFCRRQYWQRLRVTLLIWQFLSLWHVYTMFFWILRRKKP